MVTIAPGGIRVVTVRLIYYLFILVSDRPISHDPTSPTGKYGDCHFRASQSLFESGEDGR